MSEEAQEVGTVRNKLTRTIGGRQWYYWRENGRVWCEELPDGVAVPYETFTHLEEEVFTPAREALFAWLDKVYGTTSRHEREDHGPARVRQEGL